MQDGQMHFDFKRVVNSPPLTISPLCMWCSRDNLHVSILNAFIESKCLGYMMLKTVARQKIKLISRNFSCLFPDFLVF